MQGISALRTVLKVDFKTVLRAEILRCSEMTKDISTKIVFSEVFSMHINSALSFALKFTEHIYLFAKSSEFFLDSLLAFLDSNGPEHLSKLSSAHHLWICQQL